MYCAVVNDFNTIEMSFPHPYYSYTLFIFLTSCSIVLCHILLAKKQETLTIPYRTLKYAKTLPHYFRFHNLQLILKQALY